MEQRTGTDVARPPVTDPVARPRADRPADTTAILIVAEAQPRRARVADLGDEMRVELVAPDQGADRAEELALRSVPGVFDRGCRHNGSPYRHAALERSCAVLGIRLIHSRPYSPEGRGKQERLNRFIRERFLAEAEAHGIASYTELNDRPVIRDMIVV